jgi:hypothetical protein
MSHRCSDATGCNRNDLERSTNKKDNIIKTMITGIVARDHRYLY